MLNQGHRFHGYGSLKGVYSRGQTVRGSLVSLKYLARDRNKPYRAAVVVSRKVCKSAVERNRIRRRIYEAVRYLEADVKPGTDLVFTVFSDQIGDIDAGQLRDTIGQLLSKAAREHRSAVI